MANDQLFIPKKIKVGYQWREDTYTKKLAFVIYYNAKGQLAQEKSWRGWIHEAGTIKEQYIGYIDGEYKYEKRDGIPVDDFENVPTEGFVLNRKAGGYSSGWNHRQTKCRVWDPRGFEFEISVENLLFILQESNSYKGKGLEGEFVYAWSGKDIVLLPCSGEDYKSSQEFTDLKKLSVHAKTLVPGRTYYTKEQEKVVYLGRYDYVEYDYYNRIKVSPKEYIFLGEEELKRYNFEPVNNIAKFKPLKVNKLAKLLDENIHSNFADLVEELEKSGLVMPFKSITINPLNDVNRLVNSDEEIQQNYQLQYKRETIYAKLKDNIYEAFTLKPNWNQSYNYNHVIDSNHNKYTWSFKGFTVTPQNRIITIKDNNFSIEEKEVYTSSTLSTLRHYSASQINNMNFYSIGINMENVEKELQP